MTLHGMALVTLAAVAGIGVACGPPAGALVTQCTAEMLAIGEPSMCQVTAAHLTDEQTASFRFDTPWSRVEVHAELTSTAGTATVTIDQLPGRSWTAGPGTPATVDVVAPFDRGLKGVMLRVRPASAPVDGLTGTLRYKGLPAE